MELTRFQRSALGTLIWSETDENGESFDNSGPAHYRNGAEVPLPVPLEDFDADGLAEFCKDCDGFRSDVFEAGLSHLGDTEFFADDFVLTRNGHGAGFWDRGLGKDGDTLTRLSKAYGTVGLMRGDDGKIYFHG
jgi:hypothetical protein